MDIEQLRNYCITKPETEECFPFGPDTLVFKINGKIFLLVSLESYPLRFNAKCDLDKAIELREEYPLCILPGYHMNKKYWNIVVIDGTLARKQIQQMIDDSYELVSKKKK